MSLRKLGLLSCLALALAGLAASPAKAGQAILDFDLTTTTTQAGGHPDLGISFALESPGAPESAQNVVVDAPEGVFGNTNAIIRCTSEDFALRSCPSGSQAGLVTVRASHGGVANKLLGTAPIYNREPLGEQTALFAFIVPTLNIPVSIPVAVRTAGDFGLRFTVTGLTQLAPLASADLTLWGFPAAGGHDAQRFPKGSPDFPAGCPGIAGTGCLTGSVPAAQQVRPMINNPSACTGEDLTATISVTTYQDPASPTHAQTAYPTTTGCQNMIFRPVLSATPTTTESDSPSGLDLTMSAPQPLGEATTPSSIRHATITLPEGFTINPDAADGQSACPDALANFGTEVPAQCPDNAKIGHLRGRLPGA